MPQPYSPSPRKLKPMSDRLFFALMGLGFVTGLGGLAWFIYDSMQYGVW